MPAFREKYLVRKKETWAICFKAWGRLEGHRNKIQAWLRDHDESFFCEVGTENQIEVLPDNFQANFFGDPFTFAVNETDDQGKRITRLAGANNVTAARAAFNVLVEAMPNRYLVLQHGAGVLDKAAHGEILPSSFTLPFKKPKQGE